MVYTGRGDEGRTDLGDGQRVAKTNPRIEAYGSVDELNALLGRLRARAGATLDIDALDGDPDLETIQQALHTIQAALAMPDDPAAPTLDEGRIDRLEQAIDACQAALPDREAFVVAGESRLGADLQHARAVCRRVERRVVALADESAVAAELLTYLNRLSDLLFVLARSADEAAGATPDEPRY